MRRCEWDRDFRLIPIPLSTSHKVACATRHNLQGDVTGIMDMDGVSVVEYQYDAWGMPTSTNGSMAETLGRDNPFRYRGYVWGEETGLYTLRLRYDSPEWGRFVNADAVLGKAGRLLDHHLFSYCRQNPVMGRDPGGKYDPDERAEKDKLRRATKAIEKKVRANLEAAKARLPQISIYMPRGAYTTAFSANLLWFRDQVKKGGPMDYKDPVRWAEAFPRLPFPGNKGEDKTYKAFGISISASDLGNLNFSAVGKALGIPEGLLLQQAGAAQLQDHKG